MRRLAIIDVLGGTQPIYNENRTLALIVNGEIYNYVELRAELQSQGHRFATNGDSETVVHLYEEYGLNFVHRLRGMFALALWDSERRRLILARDRMGEKPLYLFQRDGVLLFASEMKAILASGLVPFVLDPTAVDDYFHYSWVPEPSTVVKGVRKLDAAHLLVVEVDEWRIEETCYWQMDDAPPLFDDPTHGLRTELETLSALVVRSDVPVGVALSAGIDSSGVAALAVRAYPGALQAFSVGYAGRPACDERAAARRFAEQLGIDFHEVELQTCDMVRDFADMVFWRDDPIADIAGYSYYSLMRLARDRGVRVLLQGQGGDELFWGYREVNEWLKKSERSSRLASQSWRMFPGLLRDNLPGTPSLRDVFRWARHGAGLSAIWKEYGDAVRRPPDRTCFFSCEPGYEEAQRKLPGYYGRPFAEALREHDPGRWFSVDDGSLSLDILFTKWICSSYLRENGVAQGDRLSMASGVEVRLPLLDYRFVETVVGFRKAQPDAHLPPKARLKAALADVLPQSVMQRPKQGFAPPVGLWYRELFRHYGSHLEAGWLVANGVLSPEGARELSTGHPVPGVVHPLSFKALVLEEWARAMAAQAAST